METRIFVVVAILVYHGYEHLSGHLPAVADVPSGAWCEIYEHVIHAVVEPYISILKSTPMKISTEPALPCAAISCGVRVSSSNSKLVNRFFIIGYLERYALVNCVNTSG